jgi:membrane-bound ClpP family serine protease
MPQAHDIVYVVLGVIIGLALIALDLMFVGSILLSAVGVAIIIFVLLPSFGFNINLFGGSSIMNNAIITGVTILIAIIGIAGLLIYLAIKAQTKPKYSGNITMVGRVGRIIDIDETNGRYKIQIEDEI